MSSSPPEPWLRGPIGGVSPLTAPLLYGIEQACEDLALHTSGLTTEQVWVQPHGLTPLGFHLRHIAGSTARLTAYLEGRQLTAAELAASEREKQPGASREELLAAIDESFCATRAVVLAIPPPSLADARAVGRHRLPATVIGLLTHIAEHTARHVGQAISAAQLARVYRG